jgi:hypothetical protein
MHRRLRFAGVFAVVASALLAVAPARGPAPAPSGTERAFGRTLADAGALFLRPASPDVFEAGGAALLPAAALGVSGIGLVLRRRVSG